MIKKIVLFFSLFLMSSAPLIQAEGFNFWLRHAIDNNSIKSWLSFENLPKNIPSISSFTRLKMPEFNFYRISEPTLFHALIGVIGAGLFTSFFYNARFRSKNPTWQEAPQQSAPYIPEKNRDDLQETIKTLETLQKQTIDRRKSNKSFKNNIDWWFPPSQKRYKNTIIFVTNTNFSKGKIVALDFNKENWKIHANNVLEEKNESFVFTVTGNRNNVKELLDIFYQKAQDRKELDTTSFLGIAIVKFTN